MKLVLDSNILFAAAIRDSVTRKIISDFSGELFIVSANYEELGEHKEKLIKKSKIGRIAFDLIWNQITNKCIFIEDSSLTGHWKKAKEIMDKIDPDDTPFIAAALATNSDIWSDDPHFDKQSTIKIWKTYELLKKL